MDEYSEASIICRNCQTEFNFDQLSTHNHGDGIEGLALFEYYLDCAMCSQKTSTERLVDRLCPTCSAGGGDRDPICAHPIAERFLGRQLGFRYYSWASIAKTTRYVQWWLAKFEQKDRGILFWLYMDSLADNFTSLDKTWIEVSNQDLENARLQAALPANRTFEKQLAICAAWFTEWKKVERSRGKDSEIVDGQISRIEALWGIDRVELPSLAQVELSMNTTKERLQQNVAKFRLRMRTSDDQLALSRRRVESLWLAKFEETFGLETALSTPNSVLTYSIIEGVLLDLDALSAEYVIKYADGHSLEDIAYAGEVDKSAVASAIDSFQSQILKTKN